jgi:3-deoxy-D-manno-octulosonic-acid transferase
MDAALDQALAWLNDRAALTLAQQAGLDMVAQGRGAADRYAQEIVRQLSHVQVGGFRPDLGLG